MIDEPVGRLDEGALRALVPRVLASLVRRGEDFDAAEDALQEALLEALRVWPEHPPRDPRAWLTAVATRRLVDAHRSEVARHRREEATYAEPRPAATEEGDDTLFLLFCCCHPELAPASQVALTLRAVAGLTTGEIADAFYVPEATMAQRISRAKRALRGRRLDQPGDLAVVLRVLYLVYTAGHAGRVHLAGEAIRLARQLTLATEEPEARGLLALMLLNHARLPARLDSEGRIVTLDRQDRGLWDTREIAEGVRVLQSALALRTEERRPGRYQVEAAIAALHDDAASAEETDWPQILAWYDDLVTLTEDPVRQDPAAVLGRAVAVGHVLGAAAGLRETDRLREVIGERHRWHAVRGHLHELDGDLPAAAAAYAEAARRATNVAERDHLVRQAARASASASPPRPSSFRPLLQWPLESTEGPMLESTEGPMGLRSVRDGSLGPRNDAPGPNACRPDGVARLTSRPAPLLGSGESGTGDSVPAADGPAGSHGGERRVSPSRPATGSLARASGYRIRPWAPADRDDVIALIAGIQRDEFGLPIAASDQPDLVDVAGFYRAGGGEFWVARYEGAVAGTIAAIKIGDDFAALRKMFVAREHRGASGLAGNLMQTLVRRAENRGIRTIFLGTTAVMGAAHRFYERHGFVSIDARELPASFPRMDVDTRFYRRSLKTARAR